MDFSQKKRYPICLLLLSMIFVVGCGNLSLQRVPSISDYSWRLEELSAGDSVVWRASAEIKDSPTLVFPNDARGELHGWTGKNPYEGHYTLTDNEIAIHVEALGLADGGDSLSTENLFINFLGSPSTITITLDTLTLTRHDGLQAKFLR